MVQVNALARRLLDGERLDEDRAEWLADRFKLTDADLQKVMRADPTARGEYPRLRPGKYTEWVVRRYAALPAGRQARFLEEDWEQVRDDLALFHSIKPTLHQDNRDINRAFPAPGDEGFRQLWAAMSTRRQDYGDDAEDDSGPAGADDMDVLHDGTHWFAAVPRSFEAMRVLGRRTRWCNAASGGEYTYNIYANQGPSIVVINKADRDERYQIHFPSGQYMNPEDEYVPMSEILHRPGASSAGWTPEADPSEQDREDMRQAILGFLGTIPFSDSTQGGDDGVALSISAAIEIDPAAGIDLAVRTGNPGKVSPWFASMALASGDLPPRVATEVSTAVTTDTAGVNVDGTIWLDLGWPGDDIWDDLADALLDNPEYAHKVFRGEAYQDMYVERSYAQHFVHMVHDANRERIEAEMVRQAVEIGLAEQWGLDVDEDGRPDLDLDNLTDYDEFGYLQDAVSRAATFAWESATEAYLFEAAMEAIAHAIGSVERVDGTLGYRLTLAPDRDGFAAWVMENEEDLHGELKHIVAAYATYVGERDGKTDWADNAANAASIDEMYFNEKLSEELDETIPDA